MPRMRVMQKTVSLTQAIHFILVDRLALSSHHPVSNLTRLNLPLKLNLLRRILLLATSSGVVFSLKKQIFATTSYCSIQYNKRTIDLLSSANKHHHAMTKHIEVITMSKIKQPYGILTFQYQPTENMIFDILTKPLQQRRTLSSSLFCTLRHT